MPLFSRTHRLTSDSVRGPLFYLRLDFWRTVYAVGFFLVAYYLFQYWKIWLSVLLLWGAYRLCRRKAIAQVQQEAERRRFLTALPPDLRNKVIDTATESRWTKQDTDTT